MVFIIESLRFNHFFLIQDKKCLREWVYVPFPLLLCYFLQINEKYFVELDCCLEFDYWAIKYNFVGLFVYCLF